MRFDRRVAVVTGAASGIGKATAAGFLKEGAFVALVDINRDGLGRLASDLGVGRDRVLLCPCDVGDEAQVVETVKQVVAWKGGINILVNNAGIIHQATLLDTTLERWNRVIRVNLTGCFLCSREVAKVMVAQKTGGRIVNVSSIHAVLSEPSASAYTASKGGMEALSRTMATELAPHKINVNVIEPGATYTELTVPMYTDSVKKALMERVPLKEIAQPEWIAGGILFLASDEARYMTGSVLTADGGYSMDGSLPGARYWEE